MSWRQAKEARRASTTAPNLKLMRNFGHLSGLQGRQKIAGPAVIEQRVLGFDAQEKPVARSQRESRHIEDRMVWHGQAAKAQEAQHRGNRSDQNRHLERNHD